MSFLSICAIVKNEREYIYEWLSYHYTIGVERFTIFDNGSDDDTLDVIRSWPKSDLVTVIPWPYEAGQLPAYREMITNHRSTSEWCAFIDVDEFLCPKTSVSVPDALRSMPADCGALYVHWLFFGSSGLHERQPGLVTETFVRRAHNGFPPNRIGKTILRLKDAREAFSPHLLQTNTKSMNDAGIPVELPEAQAEASHRLLALHHYFCKSFEEWRIRRKLGRVSKSKGDPDYLRSDELFQQHDANNVVDEDAARIMQRARSLFYQ